MYKRQVQDTLRLLLDYEAKIDALRRRSSTVVPVHLRKLPVESQLHVSALVDYQLSEQVISTSCYLPGSRHFVQLRRRDGVQKTENVNFEYQF